MNSMWRRLVPKTTFRLCCPKNKYNVDKSNKLIKLSSFNSVRYMSNDKEDPALKFSTSKAAQHKPIDQFVTKGPSPRPGIELVSFLSSFIVLSIYLYIREENDIDEKFSQNLNETLEAHGINADKLMADLNKKR